MSHPTPQASFLSCLVISPPDLSPVSAALVKQHMCVCVFWEKSLFCQDHVLVPADNNSFRRFLNPNRFPPPSKCTPWRQLLLSHIHSDSARMSFSLVGLRLFHFISPHWKSHLVGNCRNPSPSPHTHIFNFPLLLSINSKLPQLGDSTRGGWDDDDDNEQSFNIYAVNSGCKLLLSCA